MMREAITRHIDTTREYGEAASAPRTSIPEELAIHSENLSELYMKLGEYPSERPATVEFIEVDMSPNAIARDNDMRNMTSGLAQKCRSPILRVNSWRPL